ncbi:thiol:disulfide oxidoreductase [Chromatiales bacterium (ex Bugula neritina AB1)]|nr:thiol:disulfide oxidoreductase [Chromatiales bacterium (ex Bugula neritina AB1)]
MIDLYYWPTPNGWKVSIALEEMALDYKTIAVEIGAGDQFKDEFLAISPNAKMPAIVDHSEIDPATERPATVFESGAILYYLATKTGQLIPATEDGRKQALEWLFWQTGNQGPMAGQLSHFTNYAPDNQHYSLERYLGEYNRNLAVLERRLANREYILDDYSIADIISFPWILIAKPLGASLDNFPGVAAWRQRIKERPAVRRGVDLLKDRQNRGQHNAQNNKLLLIRTPATS